MLFDDCFLIKAAISVLHECRKCEICFRFQIFIFFDRQHTSHTLTLRHIFLKILLNSELIKNIVWREENSLKFYHFFFFQRLHLFHRVHFLKFWDKVTKISQGKETRCRDCQVTSGSVIDSTNLILLETNFLLKNENMGETSFGRLFCQNPSFFYDSIQLTSIVLHDTT